MTQFLITMAGSFLGTIAALALWTLHNSRATSGTQLTAEERTPRSKQVTLAAAGAFAFVAGLILYLISEGHMHAGLGAVAAVVTLITLSVVARALR